jgi:hypothetical protein
MTNRPFHLITLMYIFLLQPYHFYFVITDSVCLWVLWLCRYNFHLFPRDELQLGMPSYSFSCQPCYLSTIANDGFDFNMCIYDGE